MQEQDRPSVVDAQREQAMVDVIPVRLEHAAGVMLHAMKGSSHHGNERVGDRQAEDQDREQRGEPAGERRAAAKRERRQAETNGGRTGVAHEQPRGMEVVGKKSEQRAGEHQRDAGHVRLADDREDGGHAGGGNQRQAGREPVEPVDEVEGIRDPHDPQHGEGPGHPSDFNRHAEQVHHRAERDSERDGNDGAQGVGHQFPPRPDRPDVVPYRHQQDRQHAESQTSRQVQRQFPAACGEPLRAAEHEGDRCDDREPAKAGNRPIVDLARVGDVHRPHPHGEPGHQRREPEREGGGHQCRQDEPEDVVHVNSFTGAPVK